MIQDRISSLAHAFLRVMGLGSPVLEETEKNELERAILLTVGLITDRCQKCHLDLMKTEIDQENRHTGCGGVVTSSAI